MGIPINTSLMLGANQGDSHKATGRVAVAHSTATPNATARNLAVFEQRTWSNAYVHFAVDDVGAYAVGEVGYRAYGAYGTANSLSPLQVELCEFTDRGRALKAYANYVRLLHDYCLQLGIPLTIDDGTNEGIKTHNWVSNHWEGNHTDPIGYLASLGISQKQFAADLKTGKAKSAATTSAPAKVATSKPATASAKAVTVYYSLHQKGSGWLPEVTNFGGGADGYAGVPNHQHDLLSIRVSRGTLKYQVHAGGKWLPWVSKGNRTDTVNGCAGGMGVAIDGVRMIYLTPNGESFQQAYYRSQTVARSGWLGTVCDDGKSLPSMTDTYAGIIGEALDRLQIKIGTGKPF